MKNELLCIYLRVMEMQNNSLLLEQNYFNSNRESITKTCLCNFDPLKPHFYIVKLEFTGVYIIFLIFARKHRLWVLVRTPLAAVLMSTHNLCFEQKYEKYQNFYLKIFIFLVVKFSVYLNRHVFVMGCKQNINQTWISPNRNHPNNYDILWPVQTQMILGIWGIYRLLIVYALYGSWI